jgi:hypothetical protein
MEMIVSRGGDGDEDGEKSADNGEKNSWKER